MKTYTEMEKDLQILNDILDLTKNGIDWDSVEEVKEFARDLAKRQGNYVEGKLLPEISSLTFENESLKLHVNYWIDKFNSLQEENNILKDKIVNLTDS